MEITPAPFLYREPVLPDLWISVNLNNFHVDYPQLDLIHATTEGARYGGVNSPCTLTVASQRLTCVTRSCL